MTTTIRSARLSRELPLPVLRRSLAESWRSTIAWAVGLAASLAMYLPLFPTLGGAQMQELIDSMPPELISAFGYEAIATGAGYTQSTFFDLTAFLLLTIAGCAWGASAIAGAEESGRLELTLAHGVSRAQYALESALAILIRLTALVAFSFLVIVALDEPSELGLDPLHVAAASCALLALVLFVSMISLAVGALTGRRVAGIGAGAGVAVAGYVLNAVGSQSEDLAWLHRFSPFDWAYANSPLTEGFDGGGLALLALGSILGAAIATTALIRRDITG